MMAPSYDRILERLEQAEQTISNRIANVVDQVNEVHTTLTSHCAREEATNESRDTKIAALIKSVYGNGDPGLKTRVDRLQWWWTLTSWVVTGIIVPLGVYAGYIGLQHVFPVAQ